jgi:TfoX/Sxy family transcriptional regulator of competence genes
MATGLGFVQFVVDQLEDAGVITYRKMFGEYALYSDGKVVALLCDNRLFVKPTEAGRAFVGRVTLAPAYPGAKPSFLIEEKLEDRDWLSSLIRITAEHLTAPVPKKRTTKVAKRTVTKVSAKPATKPETRKVAQLQPKSGRGSLARKVAKPKRQRGSST